MIGALAHRLEASVCDARELDAAVLDCLVHMPEMHDDGAMIRHLRGLVGSYRSVESLLQHLLPTARHSTRPAIVGFPFFIAAVDCSEGRHHPQIGTAWSKSRALLAATLRAYAASEQAKLNGLARRAA